jgi:acyl-coenzyme A synthetase/AMP-(fatty) acid ligase
VERVLGDHPDVGQVAVVGAPDPVLGEVGVAFVVPAGDVPPDEGCLLDGLRSLVSGSLADYKAPDRVVLVDGLPLTSMMKVDKRILAERAATLPDAGSRPNVPKDGSGDRRETTNGARAS